MQRFFDEINQSLDKSISQKDLKPISNILNRTKGENKDKIDLLLFSALQKPITSEILKLILEFGVNINSRNSQIPLHVALENKKSLSIIKLLIEYESDLFITDNETPLHTACKSCVDFDIIKLLVDSGSDIHAITNEEPIHLACCPNPNNDTILFLIEKGANIHLKDENLPFHYAVQNGASLKVIEFLYNNLQEKLTEEEIDKLFLLNCQKYPSGDSLEFLLKLGAKYDNSQSKTPIQYLCMNNRSLEAIKVLIKWGFSVNSDNSSEPPLFLAFRNINCLETLNLLIDSGANIETEFQSKNVLDIACQMKSSFPIFRRLILSGAKEPKRNRFFNSGKMIEMRKRFVSFVDDFENLISLDETYDFFIKSADSIEIGFHKCIFLCRTGYPSELEDIKQKLQNFPSKDLIILRKFLYTTKYKHQDLDSAKLTKIFESIDRKDIINRNTYWHLISDISTLWNHEESKDFTFIVHEKKLNVHKAILIARSDLFKGMFISVNDSSNVVHEYSGKTYPAMKALIHFFYTDVLDCPKKVLKEIDDSARFYQLNRKTMLTFYQNQK